MSFLKVVENALHKVYYEPTNWGYVPGWGEKNLKWEKISDWYTLRYLNPDSPERDNFRKENPRS